MQSTNRNVMQGTRGESLEEAMRRGIAASEAGDKEEAHRIFQEISSRYPDALEVWVWLGWNSTSLEESEAAFQRAYALNPDSEEARLGLRWVSSQRDNQPDAAGASTPMADAESASPALNIEEHMQVGIGAVEAGDKAAGYNTFRRIVAAEPGLVEAWVWLGGTTTNIEEAESAFRRATELDPNNEEARLGLRWVALRRQVLQQPSPQDQPEEEPEPQPVQIGFRPYDTGELARRDNTPAPPPEEKKQGFFSKLFGRRK